IASLASPWNWIYRADILAKDIHWYEKNVMGTGPFKFGEYVRGSHWISKKNPDYWDKGKPYLDGYRALFIRDNSAQVAAIRGERDAAGRAREARRLRPRHQRRARGGAPAPERSRARESVVHAREPRGVDAVRAGRRVAHRPVAADRREREDEQSGDRCVAADA